MIKTLLKKQFSEIFKAYFFDAKKNKSRSKTSTVLYFLLFIFVMVGVMGAMFGALSFSLSPIIALGFGWLYFAVMVLLSILFGVFGSVFSTYSGLYLAKDNDLLLSMPIPVRAIMVSRLLGVYLMGLMYSSVAIIPAIVVYFIFSKASVMSIVGALLLPVTVSLFVLALSCIFGYFVAKISLKLKNKSFVTVLISLAFFALYYFVYFKASAFLGEFIKNVMIYGENIKERAYVVYIIGRSGEGAVVPLVAVNLVVSVLLFVTLYVISKSFIKIATSTAAVKRVKYYRKREKMHSSLSAVMLKELKRFTSSPNYMLNCGLGIVFMIAAGVFVLIKGGAIRETILPQFSGYEGLTVAAACAVVCMLVSMNDIAAPSVSLEGKTLWQIRSLPVGTNTILKSKYLLQICINIIPALFCAFAALVVLRPDILTAILFVALCTAYVVFHALYSLYCGLHKVNLDWTNEVVPIKQGLSVVFAIFGGWGVAIAIGALFLIAGAVMPVGVYLFIILSIILLLSAFIYRWINTSGVRVFEEL
ncbi:MAG: hypothetical protein J5659_03675 [Clostridia bacterium]|nr:hypothetical protein [Clostridia bacterium]